MLSLKLVSTWVNLLEKWWRTKKKDRVDTIWRVTNRFQKKVEVKMLWNRSIMFWVSWQQLKLSNKLYTDILFLLEFENMRGQIARNQLLLASSDVVPASGAISSSCEPIVSGELSLIKSGSIWGSSLIWLIELKVTVSRMFPVATLLLSSGH